MTNTITVNKTVIAKDICNAITEVNEYKNSVFCSTAEDKMYVIEKINTLTNYLDLVLNDKLTEKQFSDLMCELF